MPDGDRRRDLSAMLAGALIAPAILVAHDWALSLARGAPVAGAAGALPYAAGAIAVGTLLLGVPIFVRLAVGAWLEARHRAFALALGALDAFILLRLARAEIFRTWGRTEQWAAIAVACLVVGAARWWVIDERRRRWAVVASVLACMGALAFSAWLPWRLYDATHLPASVLAAAMMATWIRDGVGALRPERSRRMAIAAGLLALACVIAAEPVLRASQEARAALHVRSVFPRSWKRLVLSWLDFDSDGAASFLGENDCDPWRRDVHPGASEKPRDGRDQNCEGGDGSRDPVPPLSTARSARDRESRPDVILLSVDALRWDAAPELRRLAKALGPTVRFTRAVSPSSRTTEALASVMRGRALRGVTIRNDAAVAAPSARRDRHATIAGAFRAAGYDAFHVPTHRYVAAETGIPRGFTSLEPARFASVRRAFAELRVGRAMPIVPIDEAIEKLREARRRSTRPVLGWIHALETHEPYRWGGGGREYGPFTKTAYLRSVRWVDARLATAVERLRADRRDRPLIVVIFGDHGEEFGEHGGERHASSAYAEQVRVVLWIAAGDLRGGVVDAPVSTAHLPATLADLAGIAPPRDATEQSLVSCIHDRAACPEIATSELRFKRWRVAGYTAARYRLVYHPDCRVEELYDADRDPYEARDLASARPDALATIRALARRWDELH